MSSNVLACLTTVINDSNGKIAIFNKNDKSFMLIPKNGKRPFGRHHTYACFALYTQQPKTPLLYSRANVCKQNECGSNGNVQLKVSDIVDNTGEAQLFTITKNKPHSSMVRELPMIQKKNCHTCNGE